MNQSDYLFKYMGLNLFTLKSRSWFNSRSWFRSGTPTRNNKQGYNYEVKYFHTLIMNQSD